jgi:GNAT superfamily N-acetyltransferase
MNKRQRERKRREARFSPQRKARTGLPTGRAAYLAGKVVDGYPESEWSHRLFIDRYMKGESGMAYTFYEQVHDFENVVAVGQINSILAAGNAPEAAMLNLTMGLNVFESALYSTDGHLTAPDEGERWFGRHNVAVVGVESDKLVFRNTWGASWGDRGYGYVDERYFKPWVDTVCVVRRGDIGVLPATWDALMDLRANPPAFARSWVKRRNPWRRRIRHRGRSHMLLVFDAISIELGCPVELINLVSSGGELVGWTFLALGRRDERLIVEELWVKPQCRRNGYGTLLGQLACGRATELNYSAVAFLKHEADTYGVAGPGWDALAERLGLHVSPGPIRHRPNVTAIGERSGDV